MKTSEGMIELGKCPRDKWYKDYGKALRSAGWTLRESGPKWDAENALIQRRKPWPTQDEFKASIHPNYR